MNKIITASIVLIVLSITVSAQQWQTINFPGKININDVSYLNNDKAFIVCDGGLLFSKAKTGINWEQSNFSFASNLNSVFFNNDEGYIAGDSGRIYRIDIEGNIANDISVDYFFHLNDIIFKDYLNGIAVGTKEVRIDGKKYFLSSIHTTTNGGEDWDERHFDERGKLNAAAYVYDGLILAVGDSGKVIRSIDGGVNWTSQLLNITSNLNDIKVCPDYTLVISGDDGTFLLSRDLGETWLSINIPDYYHLNEIFLKGNNNVICAGTKEVRIDGRKYNMATILKFSLTSLDWVEELSLIRGEYNSVAFCNPNLGLAVGDNGLIASFSNFSEIKLDIKINPNPKNFYLQNYPNPFNPTTTISYQLPVNGHIVLKVYNALGSEVAILVNEEKLAGEYEVEFSSDGLPSGVYFCRLEAKGFIEVKKMILVR